MPNPSYTNRYVIDREREKVEELFDLEADIGETTNLVEKYPTNVKEPKILLGKVVAGTN